MTGMAKIFYITTLK